MEKKVLLSISITIGLTWFMGLYFSSIRTKQTVRDFYRWAHNDSTMTYESFPETATETAPQLLERFKQADEPFKKHVRLGISPFPLEAMPWPSFSPGFGSSINGSHFVSELSLISTRYVAFIRTKKEPQDKVLGTIIIKVETSLFGL